MCQKVQQSSHLQEKIKYYTLATIHFKNPWKIVSKPLYFSLQLFYTVGASFLIKLWIKSNIVVNSQTGPSYSAIYSTLLLLFCAHGIFCRLLRKFITSLRNRYSHSLMLQRISNRICESSEWMWMRFYWVPVEFFLVHLIAFLHILVCLLFSFYASVS